MFHNRRHADKVRASALTQVIVVALLVIILVAVFLYKKISQKPEEISAVPARQAPAAAPANPLAGKIFPADTILPAKTYALIRLTDLKTALEQYNKTAIAEIANDPSMKDALSRLWESWDEFKARIEVQYGLSLPEFQQAMRGQCAFAVLPPEEPNKPPVFVVIADAPTMGDKLRSAVDNLLKRWILSPTWTGVTPKSPSEARGGAQEPSFQGTVSTYVFKDFQVTIGTLGGIPFYSACLGDTFLLASGKSAIEGAITLQAGGPGALAADEVYKRVRSQTSTEKELFTAYVNMEALLAGNQYHLTPTIRNFLGYLGLTKAKALSYAASLEDTGIRESLFVEGPAPRAGLLALVDQPPCKRELLRYVPSTALWCACLGMSPHNLWTALREVTGGESGPWVKFEKEQQLDILRDLCPHLGDEILIYGGTPEFEGGHMSANLAIILKATKPVAASAIFEKILKGIAAAWAAAAPQETAQAHPTPEAPAPSPKEAKPSPPPIKMAAFFSDVPHRNHVLRVLTPPEKSPVPSLSYFVGSDYILVTRTPDLARSALDVIDGIRPALTSESEFVELLKRIPSSKNGILYYSARICLELTQRLAREKGQDFYKQQTLPLDYTRLSMTDLFTKKLFNTVAGIAVDGAGVKFEAYSAAGVLPTLALTGCEYTTGIPPWAHPTSMLYHLWVANNLNRIGAAMRKYAAEHSGAFPPGGRQAQELIASGYLNNLRLFYLPMSNVDFAGFPENIDYQFTILNHTLGSDPQTPLAWSRRKDATGGRHVLMLDGSVQWLTEQEFIERMK